MGVRLLALAAAPAAALALAPPAAGHSLVRPDRESVAYLSADATSLNALTVRVRGGELVLRDPKVDGGMDPGRCDPADVTNDRYAYIIEARCPLRGVKRLRVDLGDREDRAIVFAPLPVSMDGGNGADDLTGGPRDDVISGGPGRDRLSGRAGNDRLDGGLGPDELFGGDGDDLLVSRDGVRDNVTCGAGVDRVDADGLDVISDDCEVVNRSDVAPPPFGADGSDTTPPRLEVVAARVQRVGSSRTVRLAVRSTERGIVAASGGVFVGDLALPVDTSRQSIDAAGGGAELRIRLTGEAWSQVRRALRRRGGRAPVVRVGVVATDMAGNSREVRPPAIRLRR